MSHHKSIQSHFGIYGIILKEKSILLVKKSRGPYTGKLDLPGGRPEQGETLIQTLAREIVEETGVIIQKALPFGNYSTMVQYINKDSVHVEFHHTGTIYLVETYNDTQLIQEMDTEDSLGAQWYPLDSLTQDTLSPFALQALTELNKSSN